MSEGFYKRGKIWWVRTDPVTGGRASTGCRDRKAAEIWRSERERLSSDPRYAAAHEATIEKWIGRTVENKRMTRASETVRFYEQKLGHIRRFLGDMARMSEITPDAVDAFVAQRTEEGAHQSTVSHELTCLVQMCKLARRAGEFDGDVSALRPVGYTADYQPRERWLTRDEVEALRTKLSPRRFAVVAAAIATSARHSELWRIRPEDWNAKSKIVRIRGTKTDDSARLVPIVSLFSDLWEAAVPQLPLHWPHVTQDLPSELEALGLVRATPNDLRRTCASWLAQANVPLELARRIMGHKGEAMLRKVYARMSAAQLGALIEANILNATGTETSQHKSFENCSGRLVDARKCTASEVVAPSGLEPELREDADFKASSHKQLQALSGTEPEPNNDENARSWVRGGTEASHTGEVRLSPDLLAFVASRALRMRAA